MRFILSWCGRAGAANATRVVVIWLFFLSGFTALIYQVAWMRYLSLFFGSDVYSAAITLSSFMGGLSLGSYLARRWAGGAMRALAVYGAIDIAVGVYALLFPLILGAFDVAFANSYRAYIDTQPARYNAIRFIIASITLVIPTTLMGATLPLIVRHFVRSDDQLARASGDFYAMNTFGALCGVATAGFVLFPAFGFSVRHASLPE